jgi:hypothetical protein
MSENKNELDKLDDINLSKSVAAEQPKTEQELKQMLNSVSPWKIILPIVLGLGLVVYMLVANFNAEEFSKINMTTHTYFWIGMAALFVCIRHFCYMVRLRVITEGQFSWRKCFDLIVIWEFSSALTPTSVGGSAVSMFVISREKGMTAGRTVMIVLYTVVVDTFFFLTMLCVFFAIFGARAIFPGCDSLTDLLNHGWATAFLGAFSFMFIYGSLVFYGVIVNGNALRRFLLGLFSLPLLRRFKKGVEHFTGDMVAASTQIRGKGWRFHFGAIGATAGAWMSRFMVLNCLILAFITYSDNVEVKAHYDQLMINELDYNIVTQQVFIYAREQAMYVLMAVIPSPGAAGGAEFAFLAFHADYLPAPQMIDGKEVIPTLSIIIGTIWRLLTFYSYLIFGAIVVPRWVASLMAKPQERGTENKNL